MLARQLKAELDRLDKQEENLIDLAAEGGMAVAKVRKRLAEIQRKRDQVAGRMETRLNNWRSDSAHRGSTAATS